MSTQEHPERTSRLGPGPTLHPIYWGPGGVSWEESGLDVRLITHLHLQLRFRMSGTIPPPALYTFLVCTWTNSSSSIGHLSVFGQRPTAAGWQTYTSWQVARTGYLFCLSVW